jgi:two-component system nitrogen regulation sensor histidine kinase NtrY
MALTVPRDAPSSLSGPAGRRPLRDNPVLILVWIVLLLAALAAMLSLADRSAQLSADFLSEVVLWTLSAADVSMVVVLAFVLARNVIKLMVERRRGLPFARFRSKLVGALLVMTIIPALLVLFVGSELLRNSANRWFSAPIDDVLSSAREIASDYYQEKLTEVRGHAEQLAEQLRGVDLTPQSVGVVRDRASGFLQDRRLGLVQVYRVRTDGERRVADPLVDVAPPALARPPSRAVADRLAAQALAGNANSPIPEPLDSGGQLMRAAALVRNADQQVIGVVIASDYLTGELAQHSRRIVDAYEGYQQLRVLKRPLEGVYLSFFLMVTLLILVSATWMGLYIAKRITRPVHRLALAAREIGAGHFDYRVEPETRDEFGSLVEAFNAMADELAVSQRRLERSRLDLERKNVEAESRRRYIETVLERVATGVISLDDAGRISTINGAARRLLRLEGPLTGQPVVAVLTREDLEPVAAVVRRALRRPGQPVAQEVALAIDGDELHLALAATSFRGEDGSEGVVIVLDDVTPLIRAQRVAAWRDVARRLAHEVKNPLTPIQLCAERLRRHFSHAAEPTRHLVDECSRTIVTEVDSLKLLVDEFSQFARMPAPRTVPCDLHGLLDDALQLYGSTFNGVRFERRLAPGLPPVRVDPEQFRRVIINLVDNAIEALAESRSTPDGVIAVEAQHEPALGVVRIAVTDNGPGIPEAERAQLFLPYYSTKRRGSGLGLAIVRRIIVEHGGAIEASPNSPHGTRMSIELPC